MFGITPARFSTLFLLALTASPALATGAVIRFDLAPTIAAKPAGDCRDHDNIVQCQIRISSLIVAPDSPQIDQWLVVCQPRGGELAIVDYSPKTNAESNIEGPIEVKMTDESSAAMGLSLDGNYGHVVSTNIGADRGNKKIDSRQYALAPPRKTVTASGTINRGRGVYFKLRRSHRQILEGDKTFTLTFRVSADWRGSLIDVSVLAQSQHQALAGFDKQIKTMGQSNFVVAAYREGDAEAALVSRQLADAEQALRQIADEKLSNNRSTSLSGILRRIAITLDLDAPQDNGQWIWRLLSGDADPYLDKEIQRLPVEVRVAALDYCDVRDQFVGLAQRPRTKQSDRVAAYK